MFDKLTSLEERYEELSRLISDPEVIADQSRWQKHVKEHSELQDIVDGYRQWKKTREEISGLREMLADKPDPEMRVLIEAEIDELEERLSVIEARLRELMLPRDPNDEKDVIVEIRAGAGGDEAALFAAELYRMYTRFAEGKGWKTEVLSANWTDIGGIKEIAFAVQGRGAYSYLKYESGVHRVQRVPVTESGGRIHTSTATVAVLPEAEEVDVEIDPKDLRIDTFCSSGPGGQSVNTTYSAVRITHLPTGLVVTCQDEKSQIKNKAKAMRVLRSRLLDRAIQERQQSEAEARRGQVGSGDRSERIRTYNFPQNRLTDHRIGLTLYRLDSIMEGELDEVIENLVAADRAARLEESEVR